MQVQDWDTLSQYPTPVIKLKLDEVDLLAKLEYLQPGGSIKSRIGRPLIEALIAEGTLTKETRYIVEATAGNTAIALKQALDRTEHAAKIVAVVSDKVSAKKIVRLEQCGILVRIIPYRVAAPVAGKHTPLIEAMRSVADELENSVIAGQFESQANVYAHECGTGKEIIAQLGDAPPDAIVLGAGTGGTLTGIGRAIKKAGWPSKIILADPQGSILAASWSGKQNAVPGKSLVEGIGGDFVPSLLDLSLIDDAVTVADGETLETWRSLWHSGFSCGSSTACAVTAARKWARDQAKRQTCLVLFADHGSRYELPSPGESDLDVQFRKQRA